MMLSPVNGTALCKTSSEPCSSILICLSSQRGLKTDGWVSGLEFSCLLCVCVCVRVSYCSFHNSGLPVILSETNQAGLAHIHTGNSCWKWGLKCALKCLCWKSPLLQHSKHSTSLPLSRSPSVTPVPTYTFCFFIIMLIKCFFFT